MGDLMVSVMVWIIGRRLENGASSLNQIGDILYYGAALVYSKDSNVFSVIM